MPHKKSRPATDMMMEQRTARVLELVVNRRLSMRAIAELLGVSPATVHRDYWRAMRRLQARNERTASLILTEQINIVNARIDALLAHLDQTHDPGAEAQLRAYLADRARLYQLPGFSPPALNSATTNNQIIMIYADAPPIPQVSALPALVESHEEAHNAQILDGAAREANEDDQ